MYQRYLKVSGNDFDRGVEIGNLLKDQITTNLLNQTRHYKSTTGYDFDEWVITCEKYIPLIEQYSPKTLAELKGVASGAEMTLGQVLALTTAYEKSFYCENINSDKCTAFAATKSATLDGLTICGQTNDERLDEWPHELDVILHHKDDAGLETLIYTHPGIPAYMGMNNRGLSVLWTYIDNGLKQDGLPTNIIIRELLNYDNLDAAVEFLQTVPHAIPNQFTISHKEQGIASAECFPNVVNVDRSSDYLAHTNHNVFSDDEPEKTVSWSTRERLQSMLGHLEKQSGKIDSDVAKEFFKCHDGFPKSICTHPNIHRPMAKTLAAMVHDLGKGDFHIAFGNPCSEPYKTFSFDSYKAD